MFFSAFFWPISLAFAALAALTSAAIAYMGGNHETGKEWGHKRRTIKASRSASLAAAASFAVALLAVRFLLYYLQPSFQGSFFGYLPLLLCSLVPAITFGLAFGGSRKTGPIAVSSVIAAALLLVPLVTYGLNAWGPANAVRHAELPKIRIAGPEENIPPTDPNRMVKVTRSIAIFKGQTALSTEPGIASRFSIARETYTLQAVNGHRYWIAPLSPVNSGDTFWTPLTGGRAVSPGYVVVDAENPSKDAWLKTGFQISLYTDQQWSMNLLRYIYTSGYDKGYLLEPIFEVDDNWQPYYTVSYVRAPFGGVSGKDVTETIAVKVDKSEPQITVYPAGQQPKWIDRVISAELVREWANDWGIYGGEFARANFWKVAFGIDRSGTMQVADVQLSYTIDEHNVWLVPMTSTNGNDHTVVGVLVFESGKNEGVYYPGIKGFNEPSSVDETMVNARDNIKHYPVESVQLYSIYGELTWVAIYASPQSIGKSFGGIGILHAHSQDASDVVYANDMQTALRLYATQLAKKDHSNGDISQTAQQSRQVQGRVKRIAALPSSQLGGAATYIFVIEGDQRTYLITRETYTRIPLVQAGDQVSFSYLDTSSEETAVTSFSCRELDKNPEAAEKDKAADQKQD